MGEAVYYLKAEFPKHVSDDKLKQIESFFLQGSKAHSYWQNNRDEKPEVFWPEFKKEFPLIHKFLGSPAPKANNNNELADKLCFGNADDVEKIEAVYGYYSGGLVREYHSDDQLNYSATVWRFANWEPLCNFLKSEFGAERAGYVSDECAEIDFFSTIVME